MPTEPDFEPDEVSEPLEVPPDALSPEALTGLLESFVLREGTDYGEVEQSFDDKLAQLRAALDRGEAKIVFDPVSQSVTVLPRGVGSVLVSRP